MTMKIGTMLNDVAGSRKRTGSPSGPARSWKQSPCSSALARFEVRPTSWITTVTVPDAGLESVIVTGMRSPWS